MLIFFLGGSGDSSSEESSSELETRRRLERVGAGVLVAFEDFPKVLGSGAPNEGVGWFGLEVLEGMVRKGKKEKFWTSHQKPFLL